jgi:hypothetical protein
MANGAHDPRQHAIGQAIAQAHDGLTSYVLAFGRKHIVVTDLDLGYDNGWIEAHVVYVALSYLAAPLTDQDVWGTDAA